MALAAGRLEPVLVLVVHLKIRTVVWGGICSLSCGTGNNSGQDIAYGQILVVLSRSVWFQGAYIWTIKI